MANHPEKGHNRAWKKRVRTIIEECKMLKTSMVGGIRQSHRHSPRWKYGMFCFTVIHCFERQPSGPRHECRMKASNADNSEAAAHPAFVASLPHKSWSASGNPN